jgi:hypothetical protein
MDFIPAELKTVFMTNLGTLKDFHFTFYNPVFWLFMLVLFLSLLRIWPAKKSFSFTSIISIILLLTTEAERYFAEMLPQPPGTPDLGIVRIISIAIMGIVTLVYLFMG